jgi:hypothetical protein
VKGLRAHEESLGFFTAAAFRYYLPAYIVASIRHPDEADVIPDGIIFHLKNDLAGGSKRLSTFSPNEREAVARFIEWLADYWYPRLPRQTRRRREHLDLSKLADTIRTSNMAPGTKNSP